MGFIVQLAAQSQTRMNMGGSQPSDGAGTEKHEPPGLGPNQDDGFAYPPVSEVIEFTATWNDGFPFLPRTTAAIPVSIEALHQAVSLYLNARNFFTRIGCCRTLA